MARNFIVIDTETTSLYRTKQPIVKLSRVYDCGWIVADAKGRPIVKRSFIVSDIFYQSQLMNTAYYAEKLPQYYEGIKTGEWIVASMLDIMTKFYEDCETYGIKKVWAFNSQFDEGSLNATVTALSNRFLKEFCPDSIKWFDIWDYAGDTICNTVKYVKYCFANGFLTDKGNPKTSAEVVYRYLTKNDDFVERHTALSDCEIELEILMMAKKRHQKVRFTRGDGWRCAWNIKNNLF